jgi:tetratricopeptide (TPR) repeat protein
MKNLLRRIAENFRGAETSVIAPTAIATGRSAQECVEAALVHHRAGRLDVAASLYREVLATDAGNFDALHMLGVVCQQLGQSAEAAEFIERAVAIVPRNAVAHGNLAHAYQSLNRLNDAEASLRKAIALQPDWDDAHNTLGTVLRISGRVSDSEASFRDAVRLNPANVDALGNLGRICRERGLLDEAMDCLSRALAMRPGDANLAVDVGSIHAARSELVEAERWFRTVLLADANRFDAMCNLGDVLRRRGMLEDAEAYSRTALALRPSDPDALNTLACVLLRTEALEEAEACCLKALAIRSDDAPTQVTLGNVLTARNRPRDAEASFRSALRSQPNSASARYNLSMLALMRGDYQEGLALYESRFDVMQGDFGIAPAIRQLLKDGRRWQGEPLGGRRLLVWTEQGFGDSLMMLRYLPLLEERGAGQVIVLCERALDRVACSIIEMTIGVSCAQKLPADGFDLHCPIMSLPFLFDTTLDTIPERVPYIAVPRHLVAAWSARMSPHEKPRVGLAWAGSRTLRDDARRSIPLAAFRPIIGSAAVPLISLQKESGADDSRAFHGQITDWMAECEDFMDTAALATNLDLVITVDSAVAHLAGAIGRPVWLLNRSASEWRWGLKSDRSPWYPTMRIFRQPEGEGWDGVIAQVAEELEVFQRTQIDRTQT